MIRLLIGLSVLASCIALVLPILQAVLRDAYTDDRSAWYLANPSMEHPYICKKIQAGACDYAWRHFQSHCYLPVSNLTNRGDAQQSCEAMNSSLVSIHSDEENARVSTLCLALGDLVAATDSDGDGRPSCFIGLRQPVSGKGNWSWDDGSDISYTRWGRARKLVGDYEAVTVNGDWTWGGINDVASLVGNAIVMCCSTAILIYGASAGDSWAFKVGLGCDCGCSILCVATFFLWGLSHVVKDPSRCLPLLALCLAQGLMTSLILMIALCFTGFEHKLVTTIPVARRFEPACTHVQPQVLPPDEA